jgi:hypothetical protein
MAPPRSCSVEALSGIAPHALHAVIWQTPACWPAGRSMHGDRNPLHGLTMNCAISSKIVNKRIELACFAQCFSNLLHRICRPVGTNRR